MPEVFKAGAIGADAKAMDEIYFYLLTAEKGMLETKLIDFARERIPITSVMKALELMERGGKIRATAQNQSTGLRTFTAIPKD